MPNNNSTKQLKKTLGFSAAFATVVGMVIGSGVFFKPYAIFNATGGAPGLGIWAWIVAGILSIAGALTAAEVAAAIPKTGGIVAYIRDLYGEKLGFLTGWMDSVIFQTGSTAAIAVVFGQQAAALLGFGSNHWGAKVGIAIGTIVFLSVMNNLGSKIGGNIQTVATIAKFIPLLGIIIFGFIKGNGNPIMTPLVGEEVSIGSAFAPALLAALFAFDGWLGVGTLAGEMKNPKKVMPQALIAGISVVTLVYLVINIAYLWVMPADQLMLTENPAASVSQVIFGEAGGTFITIGILISVFGGLNGYVMTASRSTYTLASTGAIPFSKVLTKVNKNGVPSNAIWYICIVSSIYCLTGKFDLLTDISIFTVWIFYTLTFIGVFILRKKHPEIERPYHVPLYPFIPIVAIIGGGYIVISTLFTQFAYAMTGIIITALGIPVYYYMKRKNSFTN